MAQPEQSEGEPSGCPLAGGSANKVDLAARLTRAHALGASPHACGVPVGLLTSPTHNTAFEAPHDCNFTTRGKKWSLHEGLHLDLELRGLASCLLDDEGKNGVPHAWDSGR